RLVNLSFCAGGRLRPVSKWRQAAAGLAGLRRQRFVFMAKGKTAQKKVPRLTEATVKALATAQTFERGREYYEDDAVSETTVRGLELHGECAGSRGNPYEVSATLKAGGIKDSSCTCPYQ